MPVCEPECRWCVGRHEERDAVGMEAGVYAGGKHCIFREKPVYKAEGRQELPHRAAAVFFTIKARFPMGRRKDCGRTGINRTEMPKNLKIPCAVRKYCTCILCKTMVQYYIIQLYGMMVENDGIFA